MSASARGFMLALKLLSCFNPYNLLLPASNTHAHTHTRAHTHMYACTHTLAHTTHSHSCTNAQGRIRTRTHACIRARTQTTRTHAHTSCTQNTHHNQARIHALGKGCKCAGGPSAHRMLGKPCHAICLHGGTGRHMQNTLTAPVW